MARKGSSVLMFPQFLHVSVRASAPACDAVEPAEVAHAALRRQRTHPRRRKDPHRARQLVHRAESLAVPAIPGLRAPALPC
eukprot:1589689-Pyramimonas_sp.AAC.1